MNVGGCLLLITIVAWSCVLVSAEYSPSKARKERHILPLLGFLQGYKIGQNFALQLPPFVLSPILVLSSVNQQQTANIQEGTEDNLDESIDTLHIIPPATLVQGHNETKRREFNAEFENFVTTESVLVEDDETDSEEDIFRQNVIGIDNSTTTTRNEEKNSSVITTTETTEIISTTEADLNLTTIAQGLYPTAVYKNELVNTITLTEANVETMIMLPSVQNNWQNFKPKRTREDNTLEARSDAWGNSLSHTTPPYIYNKFPYPPSYNDIDSSNLYGPDYSTYNRWHTYSSPGKYQMTSQFRPIAGLYYDGFLHRSPVKKTGFVPYNNNYYY